MVLSKENAKGQVIKAKACALRTQRGEYKRGLYFTINT